MPNNNCPQPEGTILRLNLGPTEINLLGLEVLLPNGLCLIVRAGDLGVESLSNPNSPRARRYVINQLRKELRRKGYRVQGKLVNNGRSRSQIVIRRIKRRR